MEYERESADGFSSAGSKYAWELKSHPSAQAQGTEKALWVRNETYTGKIQQVGMLEKKSADEEYTLGFMCTYMLYSLQAIIKHKVQST